MIVDFSFLYPQMYKKKLNYNQLFTYIFYNIMYSAVLPFLVLWSDIKVLFVVYN